MVEISLVLILNVLVTCCVNQIGCSLNVSLMFCNCLLSVLVEYSSYYVEVTTELYKLFNKYENKFGAARSQRAAQASNHTGKKKQAWGRIFGGGTGVVGPSPTSAPTSSSSIFASVVCELSVYYLDSDNVTAYDDEIGIFL